MLVPVGAGVIIVLVSLLLGPAAEGHGSSEILESIWVRSGRVKLRAALARGFLTLVAVAMGASVGREGALIYFGAAVASWLGRRANVDADQLKLLVACGASAGIAAAYNTPIGGALFGLEVFLGGLSLELYGPIIFATVSATLISRTLLEDHPSYVIPPYKLEHARELLLYLVLGALVGVVSALFVRTVDARRRACRSLVGKRVRRILPIAALAILGAAGIFYPQLYGNGYDTVNMALVGALPLGLILALPLLKLGVSVLCASSGVPGGLFTPSLFVGALTGAAFGSSAHWLWPNVVPSTGGYVLVGMAAILAGSTHATIAAALMLFEMTGSYGVILPLLAACVVSAAVSRALAPESIYTAPLKRKGVELPRITRPAWMQRTGVRSLVRADAPQGAAADAPRRRGRQDGAPRRRRRPLRRRRRRRAARHDLARHAARGARRSARPRSRRRRRRHGARRRRLRRRVAVGGDAARARRRVDAPAGGLAARGQPLRRHARHPRRARRRAARRHAQLGLTLVLVFVFAAVAAAFSS